MSDTKLFTIGSSHIHEQGLFAACAIRAGTAIVQYLGEILSKAESVRRGLEREAQARESGAGRVYLFGRTQREENMLHLVL